MARLPQPGGDSGNWGTILNDYLAQSHNSDGTIKEGSVSSGMIADNAVTAAALAPKSVDANAIADGSITESLLTGAVQTKLNTPASITDGSVTRQNLESPVQVSLNRADAAQLPSPRTIFVQPSTGSDAFDGSSWRNAVQTISRAAILAPVGGIIEIAAGTTIDAGDGIDLDSSKLLTLRSSLGVLSRRQHDTSGGGSVYVTSTTSPNYFIRIGDPTKSNVYGWRFEGIYFDLGALADNGAAILGYAINRTYFKDCGGRALGARADKTYFLRTNKGVGDDASWLLFENVMLYGGRLGDLVSGNYCRFPGTNVIGNTSVPLLGPCLKMEYASQTDFTGLNVEGWTTAVSAFGTRGLMGKLVGESCGTILSMDSCYDAVITVNSAAGPGNSVVRDINGDNNVILGTVQVVREGNTTRGVQVNSYGQAPIQLAADYIGPIVAPRIGMPATASEVMPFGTYDLLISAVPTLEFWNGTVWTDVWANVNYRRLMTGLANGEGVVVDAAHKRFRYRAGGMFNNINGLLYVTIAKPDGGDSTIIVRRILADNTTVEWSKQLIYKNSAGARGFEAVIPQGGSGDVIEIEFNLDLTGAQTASLLQVHLFTHNHHQNMPGRWLHGKLTPEGQLGVSRGSIYHAAGYATDSTDAGLWVKHSNEGNLTGWQRVITEGQRIVTSSPDGSKWQINVANDGSLSSTKLS